MKIAHVCPFYTPAIGGVKQVVEELAQRQVKEGHEVHVFTSDWDKTKRVERKEETIKGIKIHRCKHWFRMANFSAFWPSLFPKLLNGKFDVIHSHLFAHPHFIFSSLAAKISGAKHIHTTHCPWSDAPRSLVGRLGILVSYNIFSRIVLKQVSNVIAITPWEREYLKKYGFKDSQIVVIPNGMDKIFFKKLKVNNFKKNLKITGKLVLFLGRLSITKGPEHFVEIAKKILKERDNIDFVIAGPDEGLEKLVKKKIGKEKKIHFLGPLRSREEVIQAYQSADVYVMPSYREGLPLTLFEAMASGCPIVASPVNGIPFEISQPANGYLVKYGDNKKFKKRVLQILDDQKLSKMMEINNKKKSREYDWDLISEKTLDLYKN